MIDASPGLKCLHNRKLLILLILTLGLQVTVMGNVLAESGLAKTDTEYLVGRWVRPDGGYVLELLEFNDNGGLVATYYNRRLVHVAQAGWRQTREGIELFVELRDVDYPGSIYKLRYYPIKDRMQGVYFQAMYQQYYPVEFVRSR